MINKYLPFLFFLCFFFNSCSSYKKIPYFQNLNQTAPSKEQIGNFSPLTIQPEDILGVNVTSLNPEASAIFNYNLSTVNGTNNSSASNPVVGYLVNQDGEIMLPLIGKLKVIGFTSAEVGEQIRKKLLTFLKEPVVNIRLLNFKVSVIGDVGRPGVYPVQNERITVPEAISLAGDLNITAKRDNLFLIRELNGQREYIPLDLTSKSLFNSPHYYLKNNDIIYVQPGRAKYASVDNNYRSLSLILSALSVIAVILTR